MAEKVSVECNWTQSAGNELVKTIPTRMYDEDVFEKPNLDDVANEERAVLFTTDESPPPPCELHFQINSRFKIAALTLICSVPKVELFLGPAQEYYETVYGQKTEEDDSDDPIVPFRYDMEIGRSGIDNILVKLLPTCNEICIFGTMLHIAPNPNGITTQTNKIFDLERVQEILQDSGMSTDPEKMDEKTQKFQQFMGLMKAGSAKPETKTEDQSDFKAYIDEKFLLMERTISKRLDDFEAQQTEKLNQIIKMLEKKD